MYSPQLGRFLNPDPLVADPTILYDNNWFGDALTVMKNRYGYADNNPVNYTDPSGMFIEVNGSGLDNLLCMAPGDKITAKMCRDACDKIYAKDRRFQAICKKFVCGVLKNATCTGLNSLCKHFQRAGQKRQTEACLALRLVLCSKDKA